MWIGVDMALPTYGANSYPYTNVADPLMTAWAGHTVGGPIGGGYGYLRYYDPDTYAAGTVYRCSTLSALKSAIVSATSGDLIWVTGTITSSSAYLRSATAGLASGVIIASNRGQNGATGGTLVCTKTIGGYQEPFLVIGSNCVVSGINFVGPAAMSGTNCCINAFKATGWEVENCSIINFANGAVYMKSNRCDFSGYNTSRGYAIGVWESNTPYIHHCAISGIQEGGMGYGISEEGTGGSPYTSGPGGSFLVEACTFEKCRHHTAGQGNVGYEVRYCIIEDAYDDQYGVDTDPQHQIDYHGGGCTSSPPAIHFSFIHHNTLSANNDHGHEKKNVAIRGYIVDSAEYCYNWTKKTQHSGRYPKTAISGRTGNYSVPSGGSAICQITYDAFSGIGTHEFGSMCSSPGNQPGWKCYVHDNWWGSSAPPNDTEPPATDAPVPSFTFTPNSGPTPLTVTFTDTSAGTPTSWAWDFGDGGTSNSQNPTHTYTAADSWSVTLTVGNADGSASSTFSNAITTYGDTQTVAEFSGEPTTGPRPLKVSFANASQNADTYSWDFGDGTTSTSTNPEHTYTQIGSYDVVLGASTSTASSSLDVGTEASDRALALSSGGYTNINYNNALNASGTLDTLEVWLDTSATGFKVGTFYEGTTGSFTCRDMEEIGPVTAGSKQTFTISLTGVAGDYIGWHMDSGKMEYDTGGDGKLYYVSGDHCVVSNSASYTNIDSRAYSIYASGTNAGSSSSDTETKTAYITVTGAAASSGLKMKVSLTPKPALNRTGTQITHMLANSKGGI